MDLEHRIAKLERELRLARAAVAVLVCAAIWSSCNKAEPGPATALKSGKVTIDDSGIQINGVTTVNLTERGLDITAKGDKREVAIDQYGIRIRNERDELHAEAAELRISPVKDEFPHAAAWLTARMGLAEVGAQVQTADDNSNGTALEATSDRTGTADRSFHAKK